MAPERFRVSLTNARLEILFRGEGALEWWIRGEVTAEGVRCPNDPAVVDEHVTDFHMTESRQEGYRISAIGHP